MIRRVLASAWGIEKLWGPQTLWILQCELGGETSFFLFSPLWKDGYQCLTFRVLWASGVVQSAGPTPWWISKTALDLPRNVMDRKITERERPLWLEREAGGGGL